MKKFVLALLFMTQLALANPMEGSRFAACPDKPNCVTSMVPDSDKHYIAPIQAHDLIMQKVKEYVESQENWKLVTVEPDYIHATETSSLFKFVDDIEFMLKDGMLHFRSASRKGYYDFGANKSRIEKVSKSLK